MSAPATLIQRLGARRGSEAALAGVGDQRRGRAGRSTDFCWPLFALDD